MVEVRRIGAGEWRQLRELRLRALADAPYAFASTRAREAAKPDSWWQEWARDDSTGDRDATVVAVDGDRWVGMAGAYVQEDDPSSATVIAMWVEPSARRRGIGRALLDALERWARVAGVTRLALSVTDVNPGARSLYAGAGFVETGFTQPLRSNPELTEIGMARRLGERSD